MTETLDPEEMTVHQLRQARARMREEPPIPDELDTSDPANLSIEDLRKLRREGEAL